jgi:hypothetical protein
VRIEDGRLTTPGVEAVAAVPAMAVREKRVEDSHIAALGVDAASTAGTVIREKITKFLYIEHHDVYMAAPWHIDTEAGTWTVNPCNADIGEAASYIQKQLDARNPFYRIVHGLISEARRQGIKVEGWP